MAFALRHLHAGHVAHHIGHALHRLVFNQPFGDDRDRLGDIPQRGVGLGRGGRALDLVGLTLTHHGDLVQGLGILGGLLRQGQRAVSLETG